MWTVLFFVASNQICTDGSMWFSVMKYACLLSINESENVIQRLHILTIVSNHEFSTCYSHKSERIVLYVISDLQIFITNKSMYICTFDPAQSFRPHWKRCCKKFISRAEQFPISVHCVSAWHYHFCERTVEHAFISRRVEMLIRFFILRDYLI